MRAWDEMVLAVLAKRGVTLGPDGKMARIPGYAGTTPATDAQIRYHNEKHDPDNVNARLKVFWVKALAELAEELDAKGEAAPWPSRGMFWIRLHGVLHDERQGLLDTFRKIGLDPETHVSPPTSTGAWVLEKYRAIEAIRTAFTDDELIYADYLRQTNGHPTQAQYQVRWSSANGGQVNDKRGITTIGREFTTEQVDAAVRRVLAAHSVNGRPNEDVIAVVFARRVLGVIAPLLEVMHRSILPG